MVKQSQQSAAFYDCEAICYDQSRYLSRRGRRLDGFQKHVLKHVLSNEPMQEARVLELGCGTGRLLPLVAEQCNTLVGIDISPAMLRRARHRLSETKAINVWVMWGDASNLPFLDNTFDVVYSILVINLIPDYVGIFREVRRVLKDSGVFVFSVPNMDSVYILGGLIVNWRGKAFGWNPSGHRYSHWFTHREIVSALDISGFTIDSMIGQPPWVGLVTQPSFLPDTFFGRLLSKSLYISTRPKNSDRDV